MWINACTFLQKYVLRTFGIKTINIVVHLPLVVTLWITSSSVLRRIIFFSAELWDEPTLLRCSTQYYGAEVRRTPCCVLSAIQLPAVLSWSPPKASHLSSRTTSSDTRPIEINAASASGSSFLCLSKFQRSRYASSPPLSHINLALTRVSRLNTDTCARENCLH